MQFTPNIKSKRCKYDRNIKPFPSLNKARAIFTGFSIEVIDGASIIEIYESGFYGKGSHSRSAPAIVKSNNSNSKEENLSKIEETLVLDLEEAFFLKHSLAILEIYNLSNRVLGVSELFKKFTEMKENFPKTYIAYLYLKSKNWVVKAGTKFGGDFLIYKKGPRFYHASFIVFVTNGESRTQANLQGVYRVAETSDKDVLFLEVNPTRRDQVIDPNELLNNLDKFKISEFIPKRMDFKQYVQIK